MGLNIARCELREHPYIKAYARERGRTVTLPVLCGTCQLQQRFCLKSVGSVLGQDLHTPGSYRQLYQFATAGVDISRLRNPHLIYGRRRHRNRRRRWGREFDNLVPHFSGQRADECKSILILSTDSSHIDFAFALGLHHSMKMVKAGIRQDD